MAVITLQRLVDAVFAGDYRELHNWQAEVVGRHGLDFHQMRRDMVLSFPRLWTLEIPASGNDAVDRGLLAVLSLMRMEANEVIQPGKMRRIVMFLALEPVRSPESEAVVAFLRSKVVDQ